MACVVGMVEMGTYHGNRWYIPRAYARLAQSAERKALNLVVVGSCPTVGVLLKPVASNV